MTRTDADSGLAGPSLFERVEAMLGARTVANIEELARAMNVPPARLYRAVRSPRAPASWICLRPLGRISGIAAPGTRSWREVFLRRRRPEDARHRWQQHLLHDPADRAWRAGRVQEAGAAGASRR